MSISIEELIAEELKKSNNNVSRVARILDIPYVELLQRVRPERFETRLVTATGPEPPDIRVLGKDGWQQYVIAVRRVGAGRWPEKYDQVLERARRLFDAGTHEMFQTNKLGWVVQYLYPRTTIARRKPFFYD